MLYSPTLSCSCLHVCLPGSVYLPSTYACIMAITHFDQELMTVDRSNTMKNSALVAHFSLSNSW